MAKEEHVEGLMAEMARYREKNKKAIEAKKKEQQAESKKQEESKNQQQWKERQNDMGEKVKAVQERNKSILNDLQSGKKAADIAESHCVNVQIVYNLKSKHSHLFENKSEKATPHDPEKVAAKIELKADGRVMAEKSIPELDQPKSTLQNEPDPVDEVLEGDTWKRLEKITEETAGMLEKSKTKAVEPIETQNIKASTVTTPLTSPVNVDVEFDGAAIWTEVLKSDSNPKEKLDSPEEPETASSEMERAIDLVMTKLKVNKVQAGKIVQMGFDHGGTFHGPFKAPISLENETQKLKGELEDWREKAEKFDRLKQHYDELLNEKNRLDNKIIELSEELKGTYQDYKAERAENERLQSKAEELQRVNQLHRLLSEQYLVVCNRLDKTQVGDVG